MAVNNLEIQILQGDTLALETFDIDPAGDGDHWAGAARVHVVPDLASALAGVASLTPLMISLDHLLTLRAPSALGQEHFTVDVRRTEPVRFPDERLAGGPERFDVIDLSCGDMEFSAMIPQDAAWPHVTVHRARPRRHAFQEKVSPAIERAFLAALRDAVRPLVMPPAA